MTKQADLSESKDFNRTVGFLLGCAVVGLIGIILQSSISGPIAFVMATAAIACGAIVGFLFGVPRQTDKRPARNQTGSATLANNDSTNNAEVAQPTNLEEIADWLTKILLGAGLTQIGQVPTLLEQMAQGLTGVGEKPINVIPVVISIWLFFTILGFFLGYLVTRLFLVGALAQADYGSRVQIAGDDYSPNESAADTRKDVRDLQDQVIKLRSGADANVLGQRTLTEQAQQGEGLSVKSILWVDDSPLSEPTIAERLQKLNINVKNVKLTEAVENANACDRIVFVLPVNAGAPIIQGIFNVIENVVTLSSKDNVLVYGSTEIRSTGSAPMTSSSIELLELLRLGS